MDYRTHRLILAISTAVGTTKVVALPPGSVVAITQRGFLKGTDMDNMTNTDWDEFERVNNLLERRLELLAELDEREGGDTE